MSRTRHGRDPAKRQRKAALETWEPARSATRCRVPSAFKGFSKAARGDIDVACHRAGCEHKGVRSLPKVGRGIPARTPPTPHQQYPNKEVAMRNYFWIGVASVFDFVGGVVFVVVLNSCGCPPPKSSRWNQNETRSEPKMTGRSCPEAGGTMKESDKPPHQGCSTTTSAGRLVLHSGRGPFWSRRIPCRPIRRPPWCLSWP